MISRIKLAAASAAGLLRRPAAAVSLGFALLFAQPGQAQPGDLTFFKNYFVTGDYVVGGVGLRGLGVNGIATGSITIGGVPANADILGAFLYWQVVSKDSLGPDSGVVGATFKGNPLSSADGPLAKVLNPTGTAPCWSSGGGTGSSGGQHRTYAYRADVLRFFDVDANGRFIGNGPHVVQLPDSGPGGNAVPIALGVSLVVVFRDPTMPLKAIVIDDGGYTMDQSHETMSQTIKGFYQAATTAAKITHIVGSGQANKTERLLLPGRAPILNPFTAALGPSWDSPTFNVTLSSPYDSATTSVDHVGSNSFDCLTWGATIFSTPVLDTDGDGLLDIWETDTGLTDPNGQPLPNLNAMGATPDHQDLFVEVGYMSAAEGTTYGGVPKPAHTHLPTQAALKLAGDAFKNAPVSNPDLSTGINVHFDVGNSYPSGEADSYIIRAGLARGGEAIDETVTVCVRGPGDPPWVCQFSAHPGTVGWKTGFKFLRDQLLNTPPPLTPGGDDPCDAAGNDESGAACERRFDRNRKDMFHYVLSVHALGLPMATCLNEDGSVNADCQQNDPNFHIPRTNSGVGDFPGGDAMLALGAFADAAGKPVGTPFMQGSTLMHELGHSFELTHAGVLPLPPLLREPNCKPNYLSVMNYLFQLRGLFDDDPLQPGVPRLDFSGEALGEIDESFLTDGPLSGTPRYHSGWYAPRSASSIGSAAKNHCDGSPLTPAEETDRVAGFGMVRVDGTSVGGSIDWNLDPSTSPSQDINFDGITAGLNPGSNDWANLRLNQVGGRRNVGGLFFDDQGHLALGPLSLDVGRGDIGRGDIGRGDIGRGDIGRGDIGRGDIGRGDIGAADEVDLEIATAWGNTPPNALTAGVIGSGDNCLGLSPSDCHRIQLNWKAPNVGSVVQYFAYRFRTDDLAQIRTLVGQRAAVLGVVDYAIVDTHELPNANFTYFVVAEFVDDDGNPLTPPPLSGPSNFATILAVNDPPVTNPDSYTINQGTTLNVVAPGVLGNDTDVDSATLTAVRVTGPSSGNVVVLNANGSFTYTPKASFYGSDSFTYTANDVDPSRSSNVATVTITVRDITPPVVTLTIPAPTGSNGYFKATTPASVPVMVVVTASDPSNVTSIRCTDNLGLPIPVASGINASPASGSLSVSAEGTHNLICTATDSAGNSGAAGGSSNTGAVKIDTVAPIVTITTPANNGTYLLNLNASVASSYTCSDPVPGSGLTTCVGPVSFNTGTVGPKTFTVNASDAAGNVSNKTNTYYVVYQFLLTPPKSPSNLGNAVPLTWQLKGATGTNISDLNSLITLTSYFTPGVQPANGVCPVTYPGTAQTKKVQLYSPATGATGGSDFRFIQSSLSYRFNWDTKSALPSGPGCYTIVWQFNDNSGPAPGYAILDQSLLKKTSVQLK